MTLDGANAQHIHIEEGGKLVCGPKVVVSGNISCASNTTVQVHSPNASSHVIATVSSPWTSVGPHHYLNLKLYNAYYEALSGHPSFKAVLALTAHKDSDALACTNNDIPWAFWSKLHTHTMQFLALCGICKSTAGSDLAALTGDLISEIFSYLGDGDIKLGLAGVVTQVEVVEE